MTDVQLCFLLCAGGKEEVETLAEHVGVAHGLCIQQNKRKALFMLDLHM